MEFSNEPLPHRPKPKEKKLRPWKPEEVPVGALVRRIGINDTRALILGLDEVDGRLDAGILWPGRNGIQIRDSFEACLLINEHSTDGGKTWKPCGVEE